MQKKEEKIVGENNNRLRNNPRRVEMLDKETGEAMEITEFFNELYISLCCLSLELNYNIIEKLKEIIKKLVNHKVLPEDYWLSAIDYLNKPEIIEKLNEVLPEDYIKPKRRKNSR